MAAKKKSTKTNGALVPITSTELNQATEALTKKTALEFCGHTYNLIMTNSALIEFEQLTGLSAIMDSQKVFGTRPTLHALAAMLYVLIKRDGAKLSHEAVIELLTYNRVHSVYEAILAARMVAFSKELADPQMPTTTLPS